MTTVPCWGVELRDRSKAEAFRTIRDLALELLKFDLSPEADAEVRAIISLACRQPDDNAAGRSLAGVDWVDHLGAMRDSDDPDVWPRLN
jgi:hypothetical protein